MSVSKLMVENVYSPTDGQRINLNRYCRVYDDEPTSLIYIVKLTIAPTFILSVQETAIR